GLDMVYHHGQAGETYNIGGCNERENLYLANAICRILDQFEPSRRQEYGLQSFADLIGFVTDRPGHDRRYAIDPSKIQDELGWKAEEDFESGIKKTVEWYRKNG
ncbi:MAG: GDP-mannose 4,6-dehydratase, partial [Syntrophomonadaceae bacterium]|nr:GDP-mannose 4,6-dehydratase [Syntrophomonadaceae bacterium]